jgi:hypothetical protein
MLKDFVAMLKDRQDKEAALVEKCKEEYGRRVEFNKEVKAEFEAIGQEVPGFDNDDPGL